MGNEDDLAAYVIATLDYEAAYHSLIAISPADLFAHLCPKPNIRNGNANSVKCEGILGKVPRLAK
jgi:hypothetical protein